MSEWPTTIVQDDINAYAEVSGDFNPIHVDPQFARTTPYGATIAHGCIVGALITRYLVQDMGFANRVRSVRLKFVNAVRAGDSLRCGAGRVEGNEPREHEHITYKVSCFNQKEETVAVGTAAIAREASS